MTLATVEVHSPTHLPWHSSEQSKKFITWDLGLLPLIVYPEAKPIQPGGPPVLLGASSKYVFRRIAEYGDGWFPLYQDARRIGAGSAIDYADGVTKTKEAWAQAGREGDPDFTIFGVAPEPEVVEHLIDIGFNRIIFGLPSEDVDSVLPIVEKLAAFAHSY